MNAANILADKGSEVFTVSPAASLLEAARALTEYRVGAVVAVEAEGGPPLGIFSERDLARALAADGPAALSKTVQDVMTTALITAGPLSTVDSLMGLMTDRRVRHVIVMNGESMVGVVSIGDVVKRKIAQAEAEAHAMKQYIETA